jgi:hypothetical protein
MIYRRGDIREKHTHQIENDSRRSPAVAFTETPYKEDDAHHDTQQNADAVGTGVPYLFTF